MYPFAPCKGIWIPILGDPGAESGDEGKSKRAEKCGTKKSKERREELLGTMSYHTSSKRSPSFWLLIGARKLVFTFLRVIFFRPFRLSLVPTICPWVSEDVHHTVRVPFLTDCRDVSGKLPPYPSLKPTLTVSSLLGLNVGLGRGRWTDSQKR